MTTSRQHQEAHGIGQIEKQLKNQSEAAVELQGENNVDQEIISAAINNDSEELDEILE
ncbi:hypothetical protein [Paenibacillus psychroresistens]|uniref:hypothetical protein n=1 Tax=Paenibacillus psychroresistens TaxID=1778678 RepID=UPI0018779982|nr:hypothetical protein [Paenibacillus psychroresistens]